MVRAAEDQKQRVTFARPREPWVITLPYASGSSVFSTMDTGWLLALEVELACAWMAMVAAAAHDD